MEATKYKKVESRDIGECSGFLERLENGGSIIVAEGYVFELERRGYLSAGPYVPVVSLEHPEVLRQLYEEFVHAGSDVVLALTYYAHREKLRVVGREDDLEEINKAALRLAREVADEHGCLMAGNICNSAVYVTGDEESYKITEGMFKEQIELAVEMGADFIIAETYTNSGEAMLALKCIKEYGHGLPAVVTLSAAATLVDGVSVIDACRKLEEAGAAVVGLPAVVTLSAAATLVDGVSVIDACRKLEEAGAAVVGLNCYAGPDTMLPLLKKLTAVCKVPIAALPVTYNTTPEEPGFFALTVPGTKKRAFPLDLCACQCSRTKIKEFAKECRDMGIQYVGLCCGNSSNMTRIVAEVYGRTPPASKYSPDMAKHYIFGDKTKFRKEFAEDIRKKLGNDFD